MVAHDPVAASDAEITPNTDIMGALGPSGRLATALPEAVPSGIYARIALSELGSALEAMDTYKGAGVTVIDRLDQ